MTVPKSSPLSLNKTPFAVMPTIVTDTRSAVYISMVLIGAATLFPYNSMMTAADFYENTWPGRDLMFIAPLVCSAFTPFIQLFMLRVQRSLTFTGCFVLSFASLTALVIMLPLSPLMFSNNVAFYAVLLLMLLIGIASAVAQSTGFAMAALFPFEYTQAVMAGQGWSGVAACAARVVTKATFPDDKDGSRNGAIVFFSLSTLFTALCIWVYLRMRSKPFMQQHLAAAGRTEEGGFPPTNEPQVLDVSVSASAPGSSDSTGLIEQGSLLSDASSSPLAPLVDGTVSSGVVFGKVKWHMLHVFNVFMLTFTIFPGLYTTVTPSFDMSVGWFVLIMLIFFNVFDLLGRTLPKYVILLTAENVYIGVYLRFLLYPAFYLMAKTNYFPSSWWAFTFATLFSISNGYVGSLVMMYGPGLVSAKERGTAGSFMSFSLVAGILVGSLIALAVQKIFG